MLNVLVVSAAIIQILVGLLVYYKKRKSFTNITFGFIALTTLAWAVTNYVYTLHPTSASALETIRFVLFFVVLQNTVFYVFAHNYPSDVQSIPKKKLTFYLLFSALVAAATLSPYVFNSVTISHDQSNPNASPLILLFMIHALYSIGTGLGSLIKKARSFKGLQLKQLQFILFASVLTWVVVPITNFVITLAFHTTFFARVSPLYTLAFGGIIAYAIVAQRLFNIQAAVARSVAYTLTIATLGAFYVAIVFVASTLLFGLKASGVQAQLVYAVLALIMALSFQPVKRSFDHFSTRVFYQDAYDPQILLNKINRVLVATVELDDLLTKTLFLMQNALKVDFCLAVLMPQGSQNLRVVGTSKKSMSDADVVAAHTKVSQVKRRRVLITDYLGPDESGLSELLNVNDIAVVARLGNGSKTGEKQLGHIMLGSKKSGNPFDKQDIRMIETIANELVIAIENALHFEEIQQFNVTLQQKVDEATRRLRESNRKLKLLDETKDDFISMASHQLRTPLTSVKGYISLVLDGDAGPIKSNQRKLLDQAFTSSQRMVYLIADLLNVSRLKTGKFIIEPTPVNLADVVQDEVDQLVETAGSRSLELKYHKPAHFPVLNLDETKTRQVIMNFIDNAIYYTPAGGHIEVLLLETHRTVELRVVDDGIGVPKTVQHHLFSKFYRADNAQKARPDGTGLGLFMAKKVVIAQGGAIIFNSQEGHGSTFGFTFPKSALAADQKAPPQSK
jgi:signal transduction histidine kinase